MAKWKRDVVCSIVLFAFVVGNYAYSFTISQSMVKQPLAHPGAYMRLWLIVLAGLTAAMLVRTLAGRKKETGLPLPIFSRIAVYTIAVFVAYLYLLPRFGFFIATPPFLFALVCAYSLKMAGARPRGAALARQVAKWAAFSLVLTFALELVFRIGLSVQLPQLTVF